MQIEIAAWVLFQGCSKWYGELKLFTSTAVLEVISSNQISEHDHWTIVRAIVPCTETSQSHPFHCGGRTHSLLDCSSVGIVHDVPGLHKTVAPKQLLPGADETPRKITTVMCINLR